MAATAVEPECSTTNPCPAGQKCDSGQCVDIPGYCDANNPCGPGKKCESNVCVDIPGYCDANKPCPAGQKCESGKCVEIPGYCDANNPCGAGKKCENNRCVIEPAPETDATADDAPESADQPTDTSDSTATDDQGGTADSATDETGGETAGTDATAPETTDGTGDSSGATPETTDGTGDGSGAAPETTDGTGDSTDGTEAAPTQPTGSSASAPSLPSEVSSALDQFAAAAGFSASKSDTSESGQEQKTPPVHPLCRDRGIGPKACKAWLDLRFADKRCREAGKLTKETCEKWLTGNNNGVFPGCENKTAAECQKVKDRALSSYLDRNAKAKADEAISQARKNNVVPAAPELTPLTDKAVGKASWWDSAAPTDGETSSAVIVLDSDKDGLPDDLEKAIGTDPDKADTDGDGQNDREEIRAGTDPLDPENDLEKPLDSTLKAMVEHKPLEQPRGSGQQKPGFAVNPPEPTAGQGAADSGQGQEAGKKGLTLRGTCKPNATCLLYVYSYAPIVLTTVADENGNFNYELSDGVADGQHTVYVAITDDQGRITEKSSPLSFFVREAQAVTPSDFISADRVQPVTPVARLQWLYLIGTGVLILAAGLATLIIIPRLRRRSQRQ